MYADAIRNASQNKIQTHITIYFSANTKQNSVWKE